MGGWKGIGRRKGGVYFVLRTHTVPHPLLSSPAPLLSRFGRPKPTFQFPPSTSCLFFSAHSIPLSHLLPQSPRPNFHPVAANPSSNKVARVTDYRRKIRSFRPSVPDTIKPHHPRKLLSKAGRPGLVSPSPPDSQPPPRSLPHQLLRDYQGHSARRFSTTPSRRRTQLLEIQKAIPNDP